MKRFLHFISSYVFAIACGVATLAAAEAIGVAAYNISQRGVGILDIADVDLLNLLPPIHELFLVGLAVFLVPTALIWAGLSAIGKASRALMPLIIPLACLITVIGFVVFDPTVRVEDLASKDTLYIGVAAVGSGIAFAWCMAMLKRRADRSVA